MTAAANWVTGSGLRYPRAYRPNRASRQCWANFAIEAWKSPEEPPEKLSSFYCKIDRIALNYRQIAIEPHSTIIAKALNIVKAIVIQSKI